MLEQEHIEHIKIVINEDARPAGEHIRRYNAHLYHSAIKHADFFCLTIVYHVAICHLYYI